MRGVGSARLVIEGPEFGENAILVRQTTTGRRVRGVYQPSDPVRKRIRISSVPASPSQVRNVLPEGLRVYQARRFWMVTSDQNEAAALRRGAVGSSNPDVVIYRGLEYHICDVMDYSEDGFIEVIGVILDE